MEHGNLHICIFYSRSMSTALSGSRGSAPETDEGIPHVLHGNRAEQLWPSWTGRLINQRRPFLSNTNSYFHFSVSPAKVHSDLKRQFLELTVDKLLEQFVLNKYTGLEKPGKCAVGPLVTSTLSHHYYRQQQKQNSAGVHSFMFSRDDKRHVCELSEWFVCVDFVFDFESFFFIFRQD